MFYLCPFQVSPTSTAASESWTRWSASRRIKTKLTSSSLTKDCFVASSDTFFVSRWIPRCSFSIVFVGCHFAHMRRLIHDPTRPILFLMTYHQSAKRSISHEIKNIDVSSQLLHQRVELLSRLVQLLPEPNFFVLGRHLVTRSVTFNQSESFVMKPSLSLPGFSFSGCDVTGDFECRQPLKNKLKICFYTILKQQR